MGILAGLLGSGAGGGLLGGLLGGGGGGGLLGGLLGGGGGGAAAGAGAGFGPVPGLPGGIPIGYNTATGGLPGLGGGASPLGYNTAAGGLPGLGGGAPPASTPKKRPFWDEYRQILNAAGEGLSESADIIDQQSLVAPSIMPYSRGGGGQSFARSGGFGSGPLAQMMMRR